MNYNQRFDEHIKDQFLDYTPPVPPRIWENIARERERRKPVGFWFNFLNTRTILIAAGLLIAAGGGAYMIFKNAAGNSETVIAASHQPISTNSDATETGSTNAGAAPVTINSAENPSAPASTNTYNEPSAGSGNKQTADRMNNQLPAAHNNLNTINAGEASAGDAVAISGNSRKYQSAAKNKISIKNGMATDEEDTPVASPVNKDYTLPFLFFTAERNSTPKTAAVLSKRNTTKITEPGCPTIEKNAAGNKTYIEAYAGPDYAFRNMSDTGNSAYLQQRKESTKFSSAFSAGIRYTKVFNNGVSIRTGINYSQINEKFTYSEGNIVQVVYIINAAGDTIGSYTTTGSRYKTTHNKFKTLDVPIVLGYELGNGRLHTNINAGVIINAYSWQKGEVLDGNLQPVNITTGKSSSPYQFKTNIGVGFIGGVSVYYKLNEKLHLMAEPYFRYNLTPASKEAITFKQKYNTAGLRLGVRLDLR